MKIERLNEAEGSYKTHTYDSDEVFAIPRGMRGTIRKFVTAEIEKRLPTITNKQGIEVTAPLRVPFRDVTCWLVEWLNLDSSLGYNIHHIDLDPSNNNAENLALVPGDAHSAIHATALSRMEDRLWKDYQKKYGTQYSKFEPDLFIEMMREDTEALLAGVKEEAKKAFAYYMQKYPIIPIIKLREIL